MTMRAYVTAVVLAGMIACCADAAPPAPLKAAAPAGWDAQNRAMGYLVMHLSSINAINGLNLTRAQATALRELARKVGSASPAPPDVTGAFRGDLGEVRDVYCQVRARLLAGQEIEPALEKKVGDARRVQAHVARLSLHSPSSAPGCAKCHSEPSLADVRDLSGALKAESHFSGFHSPTATFLAHHDGLFGGKGMFTLAMVAPQVDKILTAEQKAAVRNFSCCLIPPRNMNDPVRAGQAEGGDQAVGLLRYVRSVRADQWPLTQGILMVAADHLLVMAKTGATAADKAAAREHVQKVFAKARAMSATDFELEKDKLAVELGQVLHGKDQMNDGQRSYVIAMFLTVPGAVEVYDRLIERLEAAPARSAAGPSAKNTSGSLPR